MKKVLIFGSSGHAKVVIDIFERLSYKIIGLLDSNRAKGESTFGYSVLGDEKNIMELRQSYPDLELFIAIGDNYTRKIIKEKITAIFPDIKFASAIHPFAIIGKEVKLGQGIAVMGGVVINSDSTIEDFTIINTRASVGHDCRLEAFSSLSPNVTLGGNVNIGELSAISISATIIHGITISKYTVIGASSLINKDCQSLSVYYGNPGKKIGDRKINTPYL
ncbi:acetyltransferase [uncultured Maribacter sp.]|uniref:acetyltransferase n=1 Tax=uncultured Maribacter sp. TaxID=431308 RepID=UPI0026130B42|nr:acetyltransferase [uncultured Maribacter sp.]